MQEDNNPQFQQLEPELKEETETETETEMEMEEEHNTGFTVVVRVRPPLPREQPAKGRFHGIVTIQ